MRVDKAKRMAEANSVVTETCIAFYKPYGVLCQFTGEPGQKTLADFHLPKDFYAAGRLDADSEGLLLLTSDGAVQHRLTEPKFEHSKTYWAQVEGLPHAEALQRLRKGVMIQNYRTRPCTIRLLEAEPLLPPRDPPIRFRKSVPTSWLELALTEGKNRQVRRMTASIGFPTLRLVRFAIGQVTLSGLDPGCWRWVQTRDLGLQAGDK